VTADLFGGHGLPGLSATNDFVGGQEEADLIGRIEAAGLAPFRFQQWEGKRHTRSYGWTYDFQTSAFTRAEPFPSWLNPIAERAACFAGLDPLAIAQALLTSYAPGAGIGWHRDRPVFDHVIGISLGAEAIMRFRRRNGATFDRFTLPLAPRSIYCLSGDARNVWEHSIQPMNVPRWSITFRSLRETSNENRDL
jgi:DNA oxidative demethylase